ncbi:MAG: hypothetical protein ACRDIX_04580 [Actinomycetota bacterium]
MPRRHRAARDRLSPEPSRPPLGVAPVWAQREGFTVRQVTGSKPYRCPGCQQPIRAAVQHLVVVPDRDPDDRRHWHTECWRRELRRLGR